jgi:hypothetical protein
MDIGRVPALVFCIAFPSTSSSNPRACLHALACKPLDLFAPAPSGWRAAAIRIARSRPGKIYTRLNYAI